MAAGPKALSKTFVQELECSPVCQPVALLMIGGALITGEAVPGRVEMDRQIGLSLPEGLDPIHRDRVVGLAEMDLDRALWRFLCHAGHTATV